MESKKENSLSNENLTNKLIEDKTSNDEILNTFTIELAYIAYFSISRHISK